MKYATAACLTLCFAATSLSAQTPISSKCSTPPIIPTADECMAMRVIDELVKRTPAIRAVWPGFWKTAEFGVYSPDWGILIRTLSTPPDGFAEVSARGVRVEHLYAIHGPWPLLQTGGVFPIVSGFSPNMPMDGGIEVSADSQTVVPVAVRLTNDISSSIELIIHESFHSYQLANFANMYRTQSRGAAARGPYSDLEIAQLHVESDRLQETLTSDPPNRQAAFRAFLAVRDKRFSHDSVGSAIEREQERIEGTAEFVGLRARLSDATSTTLRDSIIARIDRAYRRGPVDRRAALQARPYATGAALVYLLEESGKPWRKQVARGASLEDVLLRSLTDK